MKSERTSDSFFYFDDFAHGYQEIRNLVSWLETTTLNVTYFRFGIMKADYSQLLDGFKLWLKKWKIIFTAE